MLNSKHERYACGALVRFYCILHTIALRKLMHKGKSGEVVRCSCFGKRQSRAEMVNGRVVAVEHERHVGFGYCQTRDANKNAHLLRINRHSDAYCFLAIAVVDCEADELVDSELQGYHVHVHIRLRHIRAEGYLHRSAILAACVVDSPTAEVGYVDSRLRHRIRIAALLHIESLMHEPVHVHHIAAHPLKASFFRRVADRMEHVEHGGEDRGERLLQL